MSDKEILVKTFEQYAKNLASTMFGLNSLPTQAVVNYVVKNAVDKYGPIIDLFIDKNGNINVDMLWRSSQRRNQENGRIYSRTN